MILQTTITTTTEMAKAYGIEVNPWQPSPDNPYFSSAAAAAAAAATAAVSNPHNKDLSKNPTNSNNMTVLAQKIQATQLAQAQAQGIGSNLALQYGLSLNPLSGALPTPVISSSSLSGGNNIGGLNKDNSSANARLQELLRGGDSGGGGSGSGGASHHNHHLRGGMSISSHQSNTIGGAGGSSGNNNIGGSGMNRMNTGNTINTTNGRHTSNHNGNIGHSSQSSSIHTGGIDNSGVSSMKSQPQFSVSRVLAQLKTTLAKDSNSANNISRFEKSV